MKLSHEFRPWLSLLALCVLVVADTAHAQPANLTRYVNPFIGTKPSPFSRSGFTFDTGDVFPGAATPQGMVQFSPDTIPSKIPGGYWYKETTIKSFSLTHFSGRGMPYLGDIGFMPVAGSVDASGNFDFHHFAATFSHDHEEASPGYYKVGLDNNISVELTCTPRTGMIRTTFPSGMNTGTMLVNIGNSILGVSDGAVNLINGTELTGYAETTVPNHKKYRIYFSAVFDQPIQASGTWNNEVMTPGASNATGGKTGACLSFDTSRNKTVCVTVGISYISIDNARLNRTTENPGSTFTAVKDAAAGLWNQKLNMIRIDDPKASQDNLTVFYTELYHTLIHPNIYDDCNGEYPGFDNAVHKVPSGHHHYTHISGWDLYRSHPPLIAFLMPQEYSDIAQSLVDDAAQNGGMIPRWVQMNIDTKGMIGDGGSTIIAQAHAFGATNFDTASALNFMEANASGANKFRGKDGVSFSSLGWVPGKPSDTLEYCVSDMALAQFAKNLGKTDLYQKRISSAQNWRNIFNPATQSLTARDASGNWEDKKKGWNEGSQGQYTWMVPFNQRGLFDAMGGNKNVVARLDGYFGWNEEKQHNTKICGDKSAETHYAGNEPDESQPWSYLFAGAPWKTQKVVRDIQLDLHKNAPDGLPGNDDGGAMSSWYVFSALGIYPMISGVGGFVIGSPLFASATITREGGHVLQITGQDTAPENPYVQRLLLNGEVSTKLWLPVNTLLNNKMTTLTFELGNMPNTSWATAESDSPPSFEVPHPLK